MSLRRLIAAGVVVGMLATTATGCSANTPERNQGNRNGQRVSDAVNRRPDSYTGRTTRGLFGGRTMRNQTRNASDMETRARGIDDDFGYRTARAPARSTFGRPQARIGNTFRYGSHPNRARRLDGNRYASNRYEMNRTDRGTSGMNRAGRRSEMYGANRNNASVNGVNRNSGTSVSGLNRAARTGNDASGVALANPETVPVFFNKKQEPAPQQTAPTPESTPSVQ
ncbi:MAG: hypothetical protein FWF80_01040 [Defluviitaleaceae bacterium]|nr:hypothetical protein [Defluviitaleaceae bacterium]